MNDPYEIAPGVLNNKYGITDPAKLAVVERAAAYHIENQAALIFRGIAKGNFPQGLPKDRAVDRLAYHWGETTVLCHSETATPAHNESSSTNCSNPPAGPSTGKKSTPP